MSRTVEFSTYVAALIGSIVVVSFAVPRADPQVCIDAARVKTILAVEFRDSTIELDDGRVVHAYQSTLKPGQMFCAQYK